MKDGKVGVWKLLNEYKRYKEIGQWRTKIKVLQLFGTIKYKLQKIITSGSEEAKNIMAFIDTKKEITLMELYQIMKEVNKLTKIWGV